MAAGGKLYSVNSTPGIKKDGSKFAGNYFIDGQWVRWQRGVPRKIGGYVQLLNSLPYIIRDMFVSPISPNFDIYIADFESVSYFQVDQFGNVLGPVINRTPAGFVPNANNIWQFDTLYVTTNNDSNLIAHAAPNLAYIDSAVETPIYYGPADGAGPLIATGFVTSGGVMALNPYLFAYGNYGSVQVFAANDPTTKILDARITNQKIVYGLPVRGGNSSPAGLLWSLNSLIRVTFVGTPSGPDFRFDTVSDQSSILSSSSVIEYDSRYFWCGIDRFLMYNGIVQEVPNQLNLNFFFQNLNYAQRQKIWVTKVPQFGEIWWFFPFGTATECNHAVIYNVRENTWYDTAISRSAGFYEQVFADPVWANNVIDGSGGYSIYQHETGNDQNINGVLTAIDSYVETGDISWCAVGPMAQWNGTDRWVDLQRVEPDFWQQSGDITLSVNGRIYAQSPTVTTGVYTLSPGLTKQDMREQRRFMTLRFENNAIGGFWELGQLLLLMSVGDSRGSNQQE